MLIGHFGAALGLKRAVPKVNLGIVTGLTVLADVLWCVFLLLGWERSQIKPGITRFSPYDMQYVPWSHGVDSILLCGVATALLALCFRQSRQVAAWLAIAVGSHGLLDLLVHRPDMPALGDRVPLGLSFYNSTLWTLVLELSLFSLGAWLYLRSTSARNRRGRIGVYGYLMALLYLYIGGHFSPPPPSIRLAAISGLVMLISLCLVGAWIDRHRMTQTTIRSEEI